MIEKFTYYDKGYMPVLITDKWQIAFLNEMEACYKHNIDKVERHNLTDEVFILLYGSAILITADSEFNFDMAYMEQNAVYNIPRGVWHCIAIEDNSKIIICENNETHFNDVEYHSFTNYELTKFQNQINSLDI